MLVQTHDHRLPQADASTPIAYNSRTSTCIPPLPDPSLPTRTAHRLQRRAKAAPYHIPSAPSYQTEVQVHAPQPVQHYSPVQALSDASSLAASVPLPQNACAGAHGTILGPFSPRSDCDLSQPTEITATQMCASDAIAGGENDASSEELTHLALASIPSASQTVPIIKMPKVPKIPHLSNAQVPTEEGFSLSPVNTQAASQLQTYTPSSLPPQNTFPTPSELLSELTHREQGPIADARRMKKRKTLLDEHTGSTGFTHTDPYAQFSSLPERSQ